jgi:hypothetical protein
MKRKKNNGKVHHKFIKFHKFLQILCKIWYRFIQKLHEFYVMVNMNDICMYLIF